MHAYSTSCALLVKELVYALMDGNWTLNFKQHGVRIDGLELAGIGVDKGPLNVRCGGQQSAFVDGRASTMPTLVGGLDALLSIGRDGALTCGLCSLQLLLVCMIPSWE
jgi:hypothetical protein